jgi:hypothetical protein
MLLLEGYISNFTRARYYFLCVEFSDFYVNQFLAGQTIHPNIFHCVANYRFITNCQINYCHIDITTLQSTLTPWSFNVFLLPTCFDHQKTHSVNNYQPLGKQIISFNMKQTEL